MASFRASMSSLRLFAILNLVSRQFSSDYVPHSEACIPEASAVSRCHPQGNTNTRNLPRSRWNTADSLRGSRWFRKCYVKYAPSRYGKRPPGTFDNQLLCEPSAHSGQRQVTPVALFGGLCTAKFSALSQRLLTTSASLVQ